MKQILHICIPVFNEFIGDLLAALDEQQKCIPHAEIAVFIIDDASTNLDIRRENAGVADAFGATYIQHEENAGRSKTRNAFLKVTSAPWLLFLDGDSLPERKNFLELYLSYLKDDPEAPVYGGTQYASSVDDDHRLHHAYAADREALPVEARRKNPVGSFHANNFMIRRHLLEKHPFEERLTHYGHEDSLLAIQLE
ncbi:MAG: glycosyltransferase, partial [Bacteroidetes bacterium]|nr:glycosyltransferase [Bacteroidota bacterium]